MRLACASISLCALSLVAQESVHPDEVALKPKVDRAIAQGVEALIDRQHRDGSWGQWGRYAGGKTALCTYALLKCGVDADHPVIRRALLFLDPILPQETYTTACMILAYGAAGQAKYRDRMQELANLLIEWQKGGGDYGYPLGARDLSNTQYAALGLWTAQKYKIKVLPKVWLKLIRATLRYTEKAEWVKALASANGTSTNTGRAQIAGFGYRKGHQATGSMTTAGVSILQICKIGLGAKLGGERRRVDTAIEQGVQWLGHHFAVDKNPGRAGWPYYYLYGLERVGSLLRVERMGSHWWYLEGARHLLGEQAKAGNWPGGGHQLETRTAFALLFLRRATSGRAAVTGSGASSVGGRHLFEAGDKKKHEVIVSASGQQPLAVWVAGFGDKLLETHAQYGLRVVQVEYLDGKHIIGQVAGDPTRTWQSNAFLYRATALPRGTHRVRARVQLVAADVPPNDLRAAEGAAAPKTITVQSPEMTVMIRDVFAPWMQEAAKLSRNSLLSNRSFTASASSATKTAKNAFDASEATQWVCAAGDQDPTLTLKLEKPMALRVLRIGQAGSRAVDIGLFDRITEIEVRLNKSKPIRMALDPDQLAITTISLGKTKSVRRVRIRIVGREPGRRKGQAGFTEIAFGK